MSLLGDLYHGRNRFDFLRQWRISLPVAAATTVLALVLLFTRGLDLSIDFEGGGVWEVPVDETVTVGDARDQLGAVDLTEARVQLIRDPDGSSYLRVQAGTEAVERQDAITEQVAEIAGTTVDEVAVNTVGPTWGDEITGQAVRALVYFFIAVALYLAWRLEWRMAVGALAAVVHDLALTAGIYSLFGFEVSPATVIALLTILGYSLYDTVVVYDKIKEHEATPGIGGAMSYPELVNHSTNQVLMRSVNTTFTTILPVASMLVVGTLLLGGATLRDFSLALFVGLLSGAYSSIYIAAPVLVAIHGRDLRGRRIAPPEPPARRPAEPGAATEARPTRSVVAPGGSAPRPRKRRRS